MGSSSFLFRRGWNQRDKHETALFRPARLTTLDRQEADVK